MLSNCLVIGFGNTLRGDDGVGYQVAETVSEWGLEGVRSLSVHQLTPDLAAELAEVQQVIFVDAIAIAPQTLDPQTQSDQPDPIFETLEADASASFTGHYADPRSLLALTKILYQTCPIAYRILIPAVNFQFGDSFSDITQQGMRKALAKLQQLLGI